MMHGPEKSDLAIVAVKPANKVEPPAPERSAAKRKAAEPVERRAGTKGNADQQSTYRTQSRASVSQALERIRQVARERKKERFTALFHHINTELLTEAFFELEKNAAPGVDRLTWKDYEADLERNLEDLHDRVQRGAYRALPSRRVYIPKPDGRQRPLAVAALEDKIVQRAIVALLNAIYEEDFLGFSCGFRPGRRFSPCGKVRDLDDTNCVHHRWRSRQAWLGREPQSARQQYDWHKPLYLCPRGKAAGATARGSTLFLGDRHTFQP